MDVLERLRKLQNEYGWSDYLIAKKSGLSQGTVSNSYKRGTIPTISTLEAICSGFGITLSQFFSDDDQSEFTSEQKELLSLWAKLPPSQRRIIIELMKSIT